jgi:hypothetical protein
VSAHRSRPARRRRRPGPGLAALVVLVVVFGVGLAVGEALHDNPAPTGVDRTVVRTIEPLQVAPAAATTVTVTTAR